MADSTEALLERLRKLDGVKQVTQNGKEIHIISRVRAGNLDRVLTIAREAGGVHSVNSEKPTLEDVFLTLTGKRLRDKGEE